MMETAVPHSSVTVEEVPASNKENGHVVKPSDPKQLDAGALFVLKSRGSWLHSGYHLTTSIVGPVLLTLPFSFTLLGWPGGVLSLTLAGLVTFYSYNLLSLVLERHAQLGHRLLRFRDMATHTLGPRWAKYYVGPLQLAICFGAVISGPLVGGQSLKFIYILYNPAGTMKLYQFIVICGVITLGLAQLPSFHSLRHMNLVSLILCVAYSACATIGSIYIGKQIESEQIHMASSTENYKKKISTYIYMCCVCVYISGHHSKNIAASRSYAVNGSSIDKLFGVFNGISIIATAYACGIIPEIQATIAAPVKGKMLKGLSVCYCVIVTTYFMVAISGYWAFGNQASVTIIASFMAQQQKPLLPTWFLLITNLFTLLQVLAVTVIYLQPTNELFETIFADPKLGEFSIRNVVPRLISRSLSVVVATVLAAMLPFFGDIMAVLGAFGCIPIDFILPMVFFNLTFKPSKRSLLFWGNTFIALASSVLVVIGAIASVRQIVLDAKTYSLFSDH
ncbi:GABA transporter 1-like isoform X1 [Neltuma alba]|uniref:GABA transporter 1-like isoform X1 n=1 Tax=Neltuma alba TaxID=207710 RepID=UPI0010A2CB52|nr:GABA transporter 1-like isoform X1 [Prosopis alba]